ncbi:MAG: hypothetical protein AMXMBFR47_10830 [Planctomycetota bacterium]
MAPTGRSKRVTGRSKGATGRSVAPTGRSMGPESRSRGATGGKASGSRSAGPARGASRPAGAAGLAPAPPVAAGVAAATLAAMESPAARPAASIVRVDRRGAFSSETLPAAACEALETAFRAGPWWRDRWRRRGFRDAARDLARRSGGLALLGPRLPFQPPSPFGEHFEPIEIGRGLLDDRARLEVLSGAAPTRQEWIVRRVLKPAGVVGLVAVAVALFHYQFRPPRQIVFVALGAALAFAIPFGVVALTRSLGNRWFLLPGAIAIIRRPPRRGLPARVTVLTRSDTVLALRWVHTGKTSVLVLELWTHLGRVYRTSVSEREAMSALAAWQSPLTPPPEEQLSDLAAR